MASLKITRAMPGTPASVLIKRKKKGLKATSTDTLLTSLLSGPCKESNSKWYFDSSTSKCTAFTYGGCEGNANRFETQEQCQRECGEFKDQVGVS